jgi:hypothetical protein
MKRPDDQLGGGVPATPPAGMTPTQYQRSLRDMERRVCHLRVVDDTKSSRADDAPDDAPDGPPLTPQGVMMGLGGVRALMVSSVAMVFVFLGIGLAAERSAYWILLALVAIAFYIAWLIWAGSSPYDDPDDEEDER